MLKNQTRGQWQSRPASRFCLLKSIMSQSNQGQSTQMIYMIYLRVHLAQFVLPRTLGRCATHPPSHGNTLGRCASHPPSHGNTLGRCRSATAGTQQYAHLRAFTRDYAHSLGTTRICSGITQICQCERDKFERESIVTCMRISQNQYAPHQGG